MPRRLPPIPATVRTLKGVSPVVLVEQPMLGDKPAAGTFNGETREITVQSTLTLEEQWNVLIHEAMHAVLLDFEIGELDGDTEERICCGLALWVVNQLGHPDAVLQLRSRRNAAADMGMSPSRA